jgi:2-keto-4-pentenoate hydratase/2-oxohepta-3-ene-1,7-dioic acid hydratase in catechol pathway
LLGRTLVRLVTFATEAGPHAGLAVDGGIVDLTERTGVPSVRALLDRGLDVAVDHVGDDPDVALDTVALLPPVPDPVHVIGVGLNTRSHADEVARWRGTEPEAPDYPRLFLRSPVSQVGHGGALWVPRVSHRLDYEGELAVVIGRHARYLTPANALDAVAGYACYNDASVRDYQSHTNQSTAGKSFPHTGGFGPWLVTRDDAPPLEGLHLRTMVNGDLRQEMRADDLIFGVPALLAYISEAIALQPGDVIVTGSPAGNGAVRRQWLRPGDQVTVDIDGIGCLGNAVEAEPERAFP